MAEMEVIIPRRHMDRALFYRLVFFFAIAAVMTGIVVFDVARGDLPWYVALIGFVAGTGIGYVLSSLFTVSWNKRRRKAVMQMDLIAFGALILYAASRLASEYLLSGWVTGVALSTLSLAFFAGALFGRFFGLHLSVQKLVDEHA